MDISNIKGIGKQRAAALQNIGIFTVDNMINAFPKYYNDRSKISTLDKLEIGTIQTIKATITEPAKNSTVAGGKVLTKLLVTQNQKKLEIVWFGRSYLQWIFKIGSTHYFTGRIIAKFGTLQMESPEYEEEDAQSLSVGRIVPVYNTPKKISQKMYRKWVKSALDNATLHDKLPKILYEKFNLAALKTAIENIHFPQNEQQLQTARQRLVFEELFFMQLALQNLRGDTAEGVKITDVETLPILQKLPFTITKAQQTVLDDIIHDLQSGFAMNRLIQGDVGSGKTIVAVIAAYLVAKSGYQVAIMAPTEVLAQQHFSYFSQYLSQFSPLLLIGSVKDKKTVYKKIAENATQIIIGTHAIIQKYVSFAKLALVITDEQHRFGVMQRTDLIKKAENPHKMIMTATPIPRTLGLILYGDMNISIINQLPPGRQTIITNCVNSSYRQRLTAFVEKQAQQGQQIYIICPTIEESELELQSVLEYTANLQRQLPNIAVACLHGKMKNSVKEEIMQAFKQNKFSVLVATTVIEVGVDVPNATLIIIENAERFGLAQLHQLRGRVGRGTQQSHCVLVTDNKSETTTQRMKAMKTTTDGFKLSELDLQLRGHGDFFGTQQHGLPKLNIANFYKDIEILKEAQKAASTISQTQLTPQEQSTIQQETSKILQNILTM